MSSVSSKFLILCISLLLTVNCGIIPQKQGIKTLVLLDNWATIETHSIFFDSLRLDGHSLQFEMIKPAPAIKYFEEYYFDNIILMAPSTRGNYK
jgi:hypothetical protein